MQNIINYGYTTIDHITKLEYEVIDIATNKLGETLYAYRDEEGELIIEHYDETLNACHYKVALTMQALEEYINNFETKDI